MIGRVMRRALLCAVIGLVAVPAVALASPKPNTKTPPTVTYVVRGTVSGSGYVSTTTPGSITITVRSSNHLRSTFAKGTTWMFGDVTSSTRVVLHKDKAIALGDKVIVKFRAPLSTKSTPLTLTSPVSTYAVVQIIDQGAPNTHGKGKH